MEQSNQYSPGLAHAASSPQLRPMPEAQRCSAPEKKLLAENASPEDVFKLLEDFLAAGKIATARQLILEAIDRFPRHERVQLAKRVLIDGGAKRSPVVEPTTTEEFDWLDNPPDHARGKWIALIGHELVGMADSLRELMSSLESKTLPQRPLVHQLGS